MTATSRAIPAFLAFVSGALLVWGVRALRAPPGLAEEPPVAGALPTPPAEDPDEAAPAREPSAGDTTPADLGSTPEIPVVAGPPAPPPPKILDLAALTDEQLWRAATPAAPTWGSRPAWRPWRSSCVARFPSRTGSGR